MARTLLEYAKEAEDTAAGLHTFLQEVPQHSKDITGDIAELFAISSALRSLEEDLHPSRYGRYQARITKDLDVCLPSLGFTLDDVRNMFRASKKSRVHPGAFPGTPPYSKIWNRACAEFEAQGVSLKTRLSLYRSYLQGMHDNLLGFVHMMESRKRLAEDDREPEDTDAQHARSQLSRLMRNQEPMDDYFSKLRVHDDAHGKPPPKLSVPTSCRKVSFKAATSGRTMTLRPFLCNMRDKGA